MTDIFSHMRQNRYWSQLDIAKAEAHYSASYVGEFPGKTKWGWTEDLPLAVFYVADPKPPYTNNYLALHVNPIFDVLTVSNADYVKGIVFEGVRAADGQVIYSTYRHDYRTHAGSMVDGGWDYLKAHIDADVVKLTIINGEITITDDLPNVQGHKAASEVVA